MRVNLKSFSVTGVWKLPLGISVVILIERLHRGNQNPAVHLSAHVMCRTLPGHEKLHARLSAAIIDAGLQRALSGRRVPRARHSDIVSPLCLCPSF